MNDKVNEVADELVDPDFKPTTEIVTFQAIEANLNKLEVAFKAKTWDMTVQEQREDAAAAHRKFVKLRGRLEASRIGEKEESLRKGREVDADAKKFKARIEAIEKRIAADIKAEDDRLEAIRLAEIEKERARVQAIRDRITKIAEVPAMLRHCSYDLAELDEAVSRIEIVDASFQEFMAEASEVKLDTLGTLQEMRASLVAAAETKRQAAAEKERADALQEQLNAQARELAELRSAKAPPPEQRIAEESSKEEEAFIGRAVQDGYAAVPRNYGGGYSSARQVGRPVSALAGTITGARITDGTIDPRPTSLDLFGSSRGEPATQYPGHAAIEAAIESHFKVSTETARRWLYEDYIPDQQWRRR